MERIRRGDERLVRETDGALAVCLVCEPDFLRKYGQRIAVQPAREMERGVKELERRLANGPGEGEADAAYRAMSMNGSGTVTPSVRAWPAPDAGSLRLSNGALIERLWPHMARLRRKNPEALTVEQRSVFKAMAELAVAALNEVAHDVAGLRSPGARRDD